MDITEKILEQIAHHRAEILRLESALDVITEMTGKPIKKDAPMITVRRTVPAAVEEKPKGGRVSGEEKRRAFEARKKLKEEILAEIGRAPKTSAELIELLLPPKPTEQQKHDVWNGVYQLRRDGFIERDDETKAFHLVKPPAAEMAKAS